MKNIQDDTIQSAWQHYRSHHILMLRKPGWKFAVSALSREPCDTKNKDIEESVCMCNEEWADSIVLQGMAGTKFIRDNKGKKEMEIESTDDEKTGDYEQQQNYQEDLDEEDEKEAEELSTSDIKATSYQSIPSVLPGLSDIPGFPGSP